MRQRSATPAATQHSSMHRFRMHSSVLYAPEPVRFLRPCPFPPLHAVRQYGSPGSVAYRNTDCRFAPGSPFTCSALRPLSKSLPPSYASARMPPSVPPLQPPPPRPLWLSVPPLPLPLPRPPSPSPTPRPAPAHFSYLRPRPSADTPAPSRDAYVPTVGSASHHDSRYALQVALV